MRKLLLFLIGCSSIHAEAQTDSISTIKDVKLEMLQTPSNAAFTVMGTTPAEIQQPSTAPEFVFAVQNASNSFSAFPNNFGFSVTPYWWTHGKKLSFEEDFSSENKVRAYRHLRLSGGVVSGVGDDPNLWRYGAGLQTTLLEGKVDSSIRMAYQRKLLQLNRRLYRDKEEYLQGSLAYREMEQKLEDKLLVLRDTNLTSTQRAELAKEIQALQAEQRELMETLNQEYDLQKTFSEADSLELYNSFNALTNRYGWKWDAGIALAFDLQNNNLDSSSLYRSGLWSNLGYSFREGEKCQLSVVGAARYYYYDQVIYQLEGSTIAINDLGVVDGGLKVILDAEKISLSFEGLYRYGLSNAFESTYKLNAMLNYRFAENRMIYFSVGNDFNDSSVGDPNQLRVFVGINLGFGDKTDVEYRLR